MRASQLSVELSTAHEFFPGGDPEISGITNDSRSVSPGDIYAALEGAHTDGHRYIEDAVAAGAVAVLCSKRPHLKDSSVALFVAPDARLALSEASHVLYGRPSEQLTVIGITGTDGKTTTSSFAHQLLRSIGYRVGLLSSALIDLGEGEKPNLLHQSTPEAPEVHRVLRTMRDAGLTHAVVESTSHGLSARTCRLAHVHYRAAVLTNMSPEHLEFHGTFDQYRHDKANLFRALDHGCYAAALMEDQSVAATRTAAPERLEKSIAVVNAEDPVAPYFADATTQEISYFSLGDKGEYRPLKMATSSTGTKLEITTPFGLLRTELSIPGEFNVANLLAAVAVVQQLGTGENSAIETAIRAIRPVHGRMSVVQKKPFGVVVDFAHTPGSFERVLPFFRDITEGRLIVVFGSAGERDVQKRAKQGAIADANADIIFLTDEDPRSEDRHSILEQIATGCTAHVAGENLFLIPDRRDAIQRAIENAREGDCVLLLGKGHETSIITADGALPWNEEGVAQELLAANMRTRRR